MDEHQRPYTILFNAITDAIVQIDCLETLKARNILIKAQLDAEEMFITNGEKEE